MTRRRFLSERNGDGCVLLSVRRCRYRHRRCSRRRRRRSISDLCYHWMLFVKLYSVTYSVCLSVNIFAEDKPMDESLD